jgi:transposase
MRQTTGTRKSPGEKIVKDIKRGTRKHYSSEEKIRIVLDGLPGEDSIAELCQVQKTKTSEAYAIVGSQNIELTYHHQSRTKPRKPPSHRECFVVLKLFHSSQLAETGRCFRTLCDGAAFDRLSLQNRWQ